MRLFTECAKLERARGDSYHLNTHDDIIRRMDEMIVDFHMWYQIRNPTSSSNRCPLYQMVQQRNQRIYPFIQYIYSFFIG